MLYDVFANMGTREKSRGSKAIVIQAHPLDMSAPKRQATEQMPIAKPESLNKIEKQEPAAKRPCLDTLFNEIVQIEPRFAFHVENLL